MEKWIIFVAGILIGMVLGLTIRLVFGLVRIRRRRVREKRQEVLSKITWTYLSVHPELGRVDWRLR